MAQNTDQSDAERFLYFWAKLNVKQVDQDHFDENLIKKIVAHLTGAACLFLAP